MKVHAITLGCQMSAADGAETLGELGRLGWLTAASPEEADVLLMTTCSVRRHAEQRALSLIGRLREWKAGGPGRFLIVAGCVAERLGPHLARRFPHVDLVLGSKNAGSYADIISDAINKLNSASPKAMPKTAAPPRGAAVPLGGPAVVQPLTVMRGCACACSYCIVPSVRGPESCRPAQDILAEARAKVAAGARELTLLGQRVNAYADAPAVRNSVRPVPASHSYHLKEGTVPHSGTELPIPQAQDGRETDFADLMRLLDGVPGLRRLRFMSPHPALCGERFAAAVRDCRTICEWIHLPVQSGCDRVLALMRRGYTRAQFLATASRLKRVVPGVVLSTDIIVGFPSETEGEFAQTLALLEELRPASAFCFKYSAREGTPAAALPDDVPPGVKEERLAAANALVDRLIGESLRSQVGTVVEVLAETGNFGKTRTGLKVRWESPVAAGNLVRVRVDSHTRRTLLGEIHEPQQP